MNKPPRLHGGIGTEIGIRGAWTYNGDGVPVPYPVTDAECWYRSIPSRVCAFNMPGAVRTRCANQHGKRYTFPDGSEAYVGTYTPRKYSSKPYPRYSVRLFTADGVCYLSGTIGDRNG